MKLVVGLGNPGEKYKLTRHNAGVMVAKHLEEAKIVGVEFLYPDKFMNRSGVVLKAYLKKHPKIKADQMWVCHDDLDIKLGEYKISNGRGPKVHNGLANIYEQLGTKEFWHVRVGIDNRASVSEVAGEEYVLSRFRPEERKIFGEVLEKIKEDLVCVL